MSTNTHDTTTAETVYFSGKQAEEVGFGKFSQRQAKLLGIHVLVLDRMGIRKRSGDEAENEEVRELCKEITDLDLSGNLFESFEEVAALCALFPKLRSLTLDGNRFAADGAYIGRSLSTVRNLSLSRTLLSQDELAHILSAFPSLETLDLTSNELIFYFHPLLSPHLTMLDLSSNNLISLSTIQDLAQQTPNLHTLTLKQNSISTISPSTPAFPSTFSTLNLFHNTITSFTPLKNLSLHPTLSLSLKHLAISGNPLFTSNALTSTTTGLPLTAADGYNLTLARLPRLETLNHSRITEKERLNAEVFYLGQIAGELTSVAEGDADGESAVLARHPRWRELCAEYGEPDVAQRRRKGGYQAEEVHPRSLGARMVSVEVRMAEDVVTGIGGDSVWRTEVPKAMDVYGLLGLVGKRLDVSPLKLRLFVETGEKEVMARDSAYAGPEWWDSDDEDGSAVENKAGTDDVDALGPRQIELVPSTRALGTYVEGRELVVEVRWEG